MYRRDVAMTQHGVENLIKRCDKTIECENDGMLQLDDALCCHTNCHIKNVNFGCMSYVFVLSTL